MRVLMVLCMCVLMACGEGIKGSPTGPSDVQDVPRSPRCLARAPAYRQGLWGLSLVQRMPLKLLPVATGSSCSAIIVWMLPS